jgi:hypothetical protein
VFGSVKTGVFGETFQQLQNCITYDEEFEYSVDEPNSVVGSNFGSYSPVLSFVLDIYIYTSGTGTSSHLHKYTKDDKQFNTNTNREGSSFLARAVF